MDDMNNGYFHLMQGDCLERMKEIADGSVDMVLADIPYGEVNQKSSGLRMLDRGNADECDIDLEKMIDESVRLCSGSLYVFCGTKQISTLVSRFSHHGMTTRVGVWEKNKSVTYEWDAPLDFGFRVLRFFS